MLYDIYQGGRFYIKRTTPNPCGRHMPSHPRPLDFKDRSPFMSSSIATCAAEQDPPCDNTWLDVKCNLEHMWLLPTYLFLSSAERLNRTFIFDQLTLGVTELTLWSAEER